MLQNSLSFSSNIHFAAELLLRRLRMAMALSAMLLCPIGSATALTVTDSVVVREGARVIWDFENNTDGWGLPQMITGFSASKGCLRGTGNGGDPYVSGPLLDEKAFRNTTGVAVRIYMSASGPLELYWQNQNGGFASNRRAVQTVPGQQWTTVRFDLSANPEWTGKTISRLRLDPGAVGITFAIDYVAAVDHLQQPDVTWVAQANNFDTGLDGWTAPKHVGNLLWEEGKLKGKTTGIDPNVLGPAISLAGQTGVMAQFKATADCEVKLYWTTTEGGFSEARSRTVNYNNTGGWQLLKFDLRNHPQWAGKTITRLRLDPGILSTVDFEFDSVMMLGAGGFDDADGDLLDGISELAFGSNPAQRSQLPGRRTHERWNDMAYYSTIQMVADRGFYGKPDMVRFDHQDASSPFYQGTYFATRARGWITAPETGTYRFWISGRNGVQLLLSAAGSKYTKRVIAELNPELGTGHGILSDSSNLWDVYSTQMSEEIQLTAGQSYYLETIHTNGHGIKPHASIAWARPGKARTALELAHVQSYTPTADDLDDDYLPDAWEIQYGLSTTDNGATDPLLQGERGDSDGDGLTNREEYLLGTDPTKSDTDGDGASDYAEAKQFNTSPLVSDAILGSIVDSPTLANYNPSGTSGTWQMFDGGLIGSSFRGRIEWSFTVPSDGWWIIDLGGQLRGNLRQSEDLALGVSIDSKPLAEHIVHFSNGQPANLRVLSPYLQAGTHTFAVDIRNEIGRRNFQLLALNVLGAGGFDADNNGRPDWLDLMLIRDNQLSPVASESFVSPLFIEGSVRHLGGAEVNSSSLPVTALRGLGDLHWFANVPLNQSGGTSIGVSLETRHQTLTVAWTRWNAMAGQALTIRVGDSVKIGGWLTPEDAGNAVISVNGQTTNLAASGSFVQTFSQPGTYPVTVNHSGGTQATASIHVVAANFGTPATFYSDQLIWRSFPGVPANLKITADPTLAVDITMPEGTGQKAQLRPFRSGPHTLAARLPNGPIVALGNVTSIGVSDALKNDATVSVGFAADGYQIIRTPIVVTNLPVGGRVVLTIFRAGVTFMDGTTVKTLNASDFVDGVASVDFRFPPNLTGGYCHYIDVYDSENRHLGRR